MRKLKVFEPGGFSLISLLDDFMNGLCLMSRGKEGLMIVIMLLYKMRE